HGVYNLDLARVIRLVVRPVPLDIDVEVARRLLDAGMHRDEEKVRSGLRNHANQFLARAPAAGEKSDRIPEEQIPPRLHRRQTRLACWRVKTACIPAAITCWARRPSLWVVGKGAPAQQQSTKAASSALYAGPNRSANSGSVSAYLRIENVRRASGSSRPRRP